MREGCSAFLTQVIWEGRSTPLCLTLHLKSVSLIFYLCHMALSSFALSEHMPFLIVSLTDCLFLSHNLSRFYSFFSSSAAARSIIALSVPGVLSAHRRVSAVSEVSSRILPVLLALQGWSLEVQREGLWGCVGHVESEVVVRRPRVPHTGVRRWEYGGGMW